MHRGLVHARCDRVGLLVGRSSKCALGLAQLRVRHTSQPIDVELGARWSHLLPLPLGYFQARGSVIGRPRARTGEHPRLPHRHRYRRVDVLFSVVFIGVSFLQRPADVVVLASLRCTS